MAPKKKQNDFRHQMSEAYLRMGEKKSEKHGFKIQKKIHALRLPGLKIETERGVKSGGLCAAEAA